MNLKPIFIKTFLFFVGTCALIVLACIVFGPNNFFSPTKKYILFFNQSVNGLEEGAPVKFKGVKIGAVKKILITFKEQEDRVCIPVIIELERSTILNKSDSGNTLKKLELGLCAKLQFLSFVTGMRFIELDYAQVLIPPSTNEVLSGYHYPEIPTISSNLIDVEVNLSKVIERFSKIDFVKIACQLDSILVKVDTSISAIDFESIGTNVKSIAESVRTTIDDPTFIEMIGDFKEMAHVAKQFTHMLSNKTPEVISSFAELAPSLKTTLLQFQKAAINVTDLVAPSSSIYKDVEYTLQQISDAAQSIHALADYIERHPESILAGKAPKN